MVNLNTQKQHGIQLQKNFVSVIHMVANMKDCQWSRSQSDSHLLPKLNGND